MQDPQPAAGTTVKESDVQGFWAGLTGEIIRSGSEKYDDAHRILNSAIKRRKLRHRHILMNISFIPSVRAWGHYVPSRNKGEGSSQLLPGLYVQDG